MSVGTSFDVVVVGAGPAGSTAARTAAEGGASVLLLDREEFPRYKTCGGGITGVTKGCIPLGAPILEEIHKATFALRGKNPRRQSSSTPFMATVNRREFDAWLVDMAMKAGAGFSDKTTVRDVSQDEDSVKVVTTTGRTVTAKYLVDASGTSSRIANKVGVTLDAIDLGLERELSNDSHGDEWKQRIHLDWGPIPGSYGWVFPKSDSLTVGVIAAKGQPEETQEYYKNFVKSLGLEDRAILKESGHLTRCRNDRSPVGEGRVLLVGDSAGLLEPWTREGISFATRSGAIAGRLASRAVREQLSSTTVLQSYGQELGDSIFAEIRAGFSALRAFEKRPEIVHLLMGFTPFGWKYFKSIATGDTNLARAERHVSVRLGLGLLKALPAY